MSDAEAHNQLLRHLKSGYMRMSPVVEVFNRADWSLSEWSSVAFQERVFREIINDPLLVRYPVTPTYRQLFVSALLKRIEAVDGAELCEELLDAVLAAKTVVANDTDATYCYRVYELASGERFVVRTNANVISTTGLAMWDAGIRLLEYSFIHAAELTGLHLLELGCGTALAALHWQRHCRAVTLADYAPQVLQNAQHNMELPENGPCNATAVRYELLDMARCTDDELAALVHDVDVVVAADVLYTEELVDCVSDVIFRLLRQRPSAYVLLAQTQRTRELVELFASRIAQHSCLVVDDITESCASDPILLDIPFRSLVRLLKIRITAQSAQE
jgi:predicted nicotinamide N-methyase